MICAADLPPPTPGQRDALDRVAALSRAAGIVYVAGPPGSGKSLILRHLRARTGGRLLTAGDAMQAMNAAPPAHLEEAVAALVERALADVDTLYVDDWWSMISFALIAPDRPFFMRQWTAALFGAIAASGKRFVSTVGVGDETLCRGAPGAWIDIAPFDIDDKRAILSHHLGRPIARAEVETLDRAHRGLNGYQLESLARLARGRIDRAVTAADLIDHLDRTTPPTNVVRDDVEDVTARALVGSEAAIETLERTVIVPMTEVALAAEFGLHPARGVLLHGPPGTGKTTLGRLLAHRLHGRFFIIDGTMFAGGQDFSDRINRLLNRAAAGSPSVVFIDDADMIFRGGQARGFVRQLLSKLDGLASESQRDVCLVMTAMDVADLPPALLRSGRVDVWIGLERPDAAGRAAILRDYANAAPIPPGPFDADGIAAACKGFTPADLRSMVADARGAVAYAALIDEPPLSFDAALRDAAADIAERKRRIGG